MIYTTNENNDNNLDNIIIPSFMNKMKSMKLYL